jgi:hypothetical protein
VSYHVDIIGIEPLIGTQTLIGRVHADSEAGLRIEADQEDQLRETVLQIVSDVNPEHDPIDFLTRLAERCDYTYMIASAPHEREECPFESVGSTISVDVKHQSAQPA